MSHAHRSVMGGVLAAIAAFGIYITATGTYPVLRGVAVAAERVSVLSDASVSGPLMTVLYPPHQRQVAQVVLTEAERDYRLESQNLRVSLTHPLYIIIYPTIPALNRASGLPPQDLNIGLYDAGTIRLAEPTAWIHRQPWEPTFAAEGPVAHELGHALLDAVANGNYPPWFNEGVAQYEDFKATGFLWITAHNSLQGPLYSINQLTRHFYALQHPSLAYREGLALVEYMIDWRGLAYFQHFLQILGHGPRFNQALLHLYGVSPSQLYARWTQSLAHTG